MPYVTITNPEGTSFNVRLIAKGEPYGLPNSGLIADAPMVEFYDARGARETLGQFVSRYYLSTLLAHHPRTDGFGLCLDGGVRAWWVDEPELQRALGALTLKLENEHD